MDEKWGKVELPKTSAFEQMRLWYDQDFKVPVVASTEVNKQADFITIKKRDRDDALDLLRDVETLLSLASDGDTGFYELIDKLRDILDA